MQRLEITGNTPEELYFNCIKMLSIMLKGAGAQPTASDMATGEAATVTTIDESGDVVVEKVELRTEPVVEAPASRKRGPKTKGTKAEEVVSDEIPDLGGALEPLTLDGDIKPRLQAIAAACTKRGMSMPETVAYCQKLYAPFGIAKAPQLKPEQFAEFMEASEAYLDGSAEA